MSAPQSDALVFFGATGDLAYKKIFPALQAMAAQPPERAGHRGGQGRLGPRAIQGTGRESLAFHGGVDEAAFAKLTQLLRYVDGDYNDPATFQALRRELGDAGNPLHYLAIPPKMFATVAEQLARAHCDVGARIIVEKPFGRDLASAQELNAILLAHLR